MGNISKKPNYQAWEKFFFVKEKNWNKKWLLKPRGVFPTIRTCDEGFFTCFQALTLFSRFKPKDSEFFSLAIA